MRQYFEQHGAFGVGTFATSGLKSVVFFLFLRRNDMFSVVPVARCSPYIYQPKRNETSTVDTATDDIRIRRHSSGVRFAPGDSVHNLMILGMQTSDDGAQRVRASLVRFRQRGMGTFRKNEFEDRVVLMTTFLFDI